jgi:hypothetical protein
MGNGSGSKIAARSWIWRNRRDLCLFILVFSLLSFGAGCAYDKGLGSGSKANKVVEEEGGSMAEVAGVRITVRGNTWSGEPPNLAEYLTPLQTTIENRSGKSLLIRYNHFILANSSGLYVQALSPQEIKGNVVIGPSINPLNPDAIPYGESYPPAWEGNFTADPWYYARYYGIWWTPLPTTDMYEKALREGVLENDHQLSGFLYFQKIDKKVPRISFNAKLVDAKTGEIFGILSLPLTIE